MSRHTFALWLHEEVASSRCALLALYEQRDKLQYMEGPRLEKAYMDAVGSFEETVIKEEMECELLEKKKQMIQVALNRHEVIDEAAMEAALQLERQKMLQEAAGPAAPSEYAELTAEQSDALQELYHDIVKTFHPQTHPELTAVHRQLFQKAQEAYRRRDLEALKLIHEMLFGAAETIPLETLLALLSQMNQEGDHEETPGVDYSTDYAAASQIYGAFCPTAEEAAIQEEWTRCRQEISAVMAEMERLRSVFPYTAAEMLSSPDKIEAYKEDLAYRLRTASAERQRREREIQEMLKGVQTRE
ncbi:MAG: hypothetical protein LUG57_05950 [Oscillospiraceae bacterium]|nr:hypothetical protein [Oscillospiraceae bacterium]